jgi:ORF6N domain
MSKQMIPVEQIAQLVYLIRGQKVMLDFDLAALYGVATKVLNQSVKRNRERFPNDFMFQLTDEEMRFSRSQFVTLKSQAVDDQPIPAHWSQPVTSFRKHRGKRYRPFAFTEQGVAMLSSVAVKVNIAIMRAFVKLRKTLETNRKLARKFSDLERRVGKHDKEITAIIEAIRQLMAPAEKPRREIGFHVREKTSRYRVRKR